MRILITGGGGFLGTRLARSLLAQGSVALAGAAAQPIRELLLTDLAAPPAEVLADARVRFVGGELNALLASGDLPLDGMAGIVQSRSSAACRASPCRQ